MRERCSLKDELVVRPSRCNVVEKGVRYLRELSMMEEICRDSNNKQSPVDPVCTVHTVEVCMEHAIIVMYLLIGAWYQ